MLERINGNDFRKISKYSKMYYNYNYKNYFFCNNMYI